MISGRRTGSFGTRGAGANRMIVRTSLKLASLKGNFNFHVKNLALFFNKIVNSNRHHRVTGGAYSRSGLTKQYWG